MSRYSWRGVRGIFGESGKHLQSPNGGMKPEGQAGQASKSLGMRVINSLRETLVVNQMVKEFEPDKICIYNEKETMPDLQDLIRLVRGLVPERPLPPIWDYFPCHTGAVGGVDNFLDYYFDVEMKLHLQLKLIDLLPEALILPGVFPDLGVIVEASAFGGQWSGLKRESHLFFQQSKIFGKSIG